MVEPPVIRPDPRLAPGRLGRRAPRSEFWYLVLATFAVSFVTNLFAPLHYLNFIALLANLFCLVVVGKALIWRYHDIGRSTAWAVSHLAIYLSALLATVVGLGEVLASVFGGGGGTTAAVGFIFYGVFVSFGVKGHHVSP